MSGRAVRCIGRRDRLMGMSNARTAKRHGGGRMAGGRGLGGGGVARLCVCALVGVLSVGCVERTITITSSPSGALVYLNDREVGRTPVTAAFTFYGVYDVRLEKDGYKPLWTSKRAKAPIWDTPGLDLLAEMKPGRTQASQSWHFELEQTGDVDDDLLLDRAAQMRALTAESTQRALDER